MQLTDLIYDLMVIRERLEDKGITDTDVFAKSCFNEFFHEIDSVTTDENNDVVINYH